MKIDDLIKERVEGNQVAARYYEKLLREAHNKYATLNSFELECHARRIKQEVRLFGTSFRSFASLSVIQAILNERNTQ